MQEASSSDDDYHDCQHETALAIEAKEHLARTILRQNPGFCPGLAASNEKLGNRIGMKTLLTDQSGIPVCASMHIEHVRCRLLTDFLWKTCTEEAVETEYGMEFSEKWTQLKPSIVFAAVQCIKSPLRRALGQTLVSKVHIEEMAQALETRSLEHIVSPAQEALRQLYIRIAGSSVGFSG